ncbi:D-alanyl-D-alanine carboxypeptidase [Spirosoma telluris]|uniref:D-alanyl-D-alanine carboxypeptidase n=1 Tax=Spirosoma telluris TaxID=2183553 RepID=UPI002FC3D107
MKALLPLVFVCFVIGCSPARRISHDLRTNPIYTDHFTGVALYDPTRQKALIQYNADKPFTPASNTKLFSFYTGLLSLRDSLPVLRYVTSGDSLIFWGTGNPLLLHPDLPDTSALAFLQNRPEKLFFSSANYAGPRFGPGWAWDDYNDDYSPELAPLPIYGNVARFRTVKQPANTRYVYTVSPVDFWTVCVFMLLEVQLTVLKGQNLVISLLGRTTGNPVGRMYLFDGRRS